MAIRTGIAPDSWGVWMPDHPSQPQWWRCLDEMKIAGYAGCEIGPWGYMPNDDPKVLKNAIDARGLELVGATEGGNYLDDASVETMLKDIDDISALLKYFPTAKYIVLLHSGPHTSVHLRSIFPTPHRTDPDSFPGHLFRDWCTWAAAGRCILQSGNISAGRRCRRCP